MHINLAIFALIPLEETLLMIMLCWAVTIIGGVLGGGVLFATFTSANDAPQEAAGAALAVALVVVPYCFARACTEFSALSRRQYAEWRRRTTEPDFAPTPRAPTW